MEALFSDETYKDFYVKSIKDSIFNLKEYIQANTPLYNFTDHGIGHSERILKRVKSLYEDIFNHKNSNIQLSNAEVYILVMSIYLHDIGMELITIEKIKSITSKRSYKDPFYQMLINKISIEEIKEIERRPELLYEFIRKNHHIISALWIIQNEKSGLELSLPILESFKKDIAKVCFAHNEDSEVLKEKFYDSDWINDNNIELRVLAFLLRIGDTLDADRQRCKLEVLKYKEIGVESRIHWYKHYFVKSIAAKSRNIIITYEFPEEDELNEKEKLYFKEQTQQWFEVNKEDLSSKKVLEGSIRNDFLKFSLSDQDTTDLCNSIDKETRKYIRTQELKKQTGLVELKKKTL